MAIKIQNAPANSPHDEAAESIESEVTTETTKDGETLDSSMDSHSEPVLNTGPPMERIEVGMAFKMPVAQYTMLEFSVKRSTPFDPLTTSPDAVFEDTRVWVEGKLNELIAEQQIEKG